MQHMMKLGHPHADIANVKIGEVGVERKVPLAICFCLIFQPPDGVLACLPYGPTIIYQMLLARVASGAQIPPASNTH